MIGTQPNDDWAVLDHVAGWLLRHTPKGGSFWDRHGPWRWGVRLTGWLLLRRWYWYHQAHTGGRG